MTEERVSTGRVSPDAVFTTGASLKGALYAFGFLFLVFLAVFREGVLRAPFGDLPVLFRLVPALGSLGSVHRVEPVCERDSAMLAAEATVKTAGATCP